MPSSQKIAPAIRFPMADASAPPMSRSIATGADMIAPRFAPVILLGVSTV